MKPAYRVISFAPNPLSDDRVALGAVVYDGSVLRVARAKHIPGPECLGRTKSALLARHICDDLDSISAWDRLPMSFGPFVQLGEPSALPDGLDVDAVAWVERFVLPPREPGAKSRPKRMLSGYGRAFFRTWDLSPFVRESFRPSKDWGGWLRDAPQLAGIKIRHWTADDSRLLLMEPLVPSHPQHAKNVRELVCKLSAYRLAIDNARTQGGRSAELCVFTLPGGDEWSRRETAREFRDIAHTFVDTNVDPQRGRFIEHVRKVGSNLVTLH